SARRKPPPKPPPRRRRSRRSCRRRNSAPITIRFAPKGPPSGGPFSLPLAGVERVAPARPQGSLAVIFVWWGEIYPAHAEAAVEVNFDTVFNRMFLPSTNLSALCRALISRRRPRRQTATGD